MSQVVTKIDGINVKLTNLEKIMWPAYGMSKAELIQYWLSMFSYVSLLVSKRPFTMICYLDGSMV